VSGGCVLYGAGAVGGVIGARLHLAGHDVTLVARGDHLARIRADGLRLDTAEGVREIRAAATDSAAHVDWSAAPVRDPSAGLSQRDSTTWASAPG